MTKEYYKTMWYHLKKNLTYKHVCKDNSPQTKPEVDGFRGANNPLLYSLRLRDKRDKTADTLDKRKEFDSLCHEHQRVFEKSICKSYQLNDSPHLFDHSSDATHEHEGFSCPTKREISQISPSFSLRATPRQVIEYNERYGYGGQE